MRRARRVLLLLVNAAATALTLLTGLRDNALVALFTSRFGLVRARLRDARISYALADAATRLHVPRRALPPLPYVADAYKFHRAPLRSPASLGEDRSTCLRVNSMNASTLAVYFDDAFGTGPRREQVFLWSISAPRCDVVNLEPAWVQRQCVQVHGDSNASACDAFILDHFDQLKSDLSVQVGVPVDFGVAGAPYLKCTGLPAQTSFKYLTDHMLFQSFWAGGSYQIEFQTSVCWAVPVAFAPARDEALYRVQAADQEARMAVAVPVLHWGISVVSSIYSAVYLGFLWRGVFSIMATGTQYVSYFPASTRRAVFGWIADWVPAAVLMSFFSPVQDQTKVFRFQAKALVAANMWMNQWLYISLSILDACLNIRSVYMLLTMGAWMLSRRATVENFLFLCTALTKMAWITCFAHTVFQRVVWCVLYVLRGVVHGERGVRYIKLIRWYVDSVALFTTVKFYSIALVLQLYIVLRLKGSPTISTRAPNAKRPVYGAYPGLTRFWHCEIAIDMLFIVTVQIAVAHVVGALLLTTRLRYATHNRVLRVLQQRYFFVGWDAFVAMDALSIEVYAPSLIDNDGNEVAPTDCTCGALLRQLSSSGPSGWVRFAGEDGLTSSAVDKRNSEDVGVGELIFPLVKAERMGLLKRKSKPRSLSSTKRILQQISSSATGTYLGRAGSTLFLRMRQSVRSFQVHPADRVQTLGPQLAMNERVLHAHAESMWGSLVLVDVAHHPVRLLDEQARLGSVADDDKRLEGSVGQAVIVRDAMSVLAMEERKPLLEGDLRLRLC